MVDSDRQKERSRAWYVANKERHEANRKQWRARNLERKANADRNYRRKRVTGFSPSLFTATLTAQDHRCAICGDTASQASAADHCHETRQPRGVLCKRCNSLLGFARDDIGLLLRAAAYLAAPPVSMPELDDHR